MGSFDVVFPDAVLRSWFMDGESLCRQVRLFTTFFFRVVKELRMVESKCLPNLRCALTRRAPSALRLLGLIHSQMVINRFSHFTTNIFTNRNRPYSCRLSKLAETETAHSRYVPRSNDSRLGVHLAPMDESGRQASVFFELPRTQFQNLQPGGHITSKAFVLGGQTLSAVVAKKAGKNSLTEGVLSLCIHNGVAAKSKVSRHDWFFPTFSIAFLTYFSSSWVFCRVWALCVEGAFCVNWASALWALRIRCSF